MSALTHEALELVLLDLEAKEQSVEPVIEVVCINCYEPLEACRCFRPIMWPIKHVIYKLRAELADEPS